MQAVVVVAPSRVEVQDRPDPVPGAHDVVVEVALTGVCGTDLHIVDGHYPTARYPTIPGHEAVGRVVDVGDAVADPALGERVVIDPGIPCRACGPCRRGRLNLCRDRLALGASRPGSAAERVAVPAANCHVVPSSLDDGTAVLAEPLACAVHAFDLVDDVHGLDVLVYGAGAVGSLCAQVARSHGAQSVTVVDRNPVRARGARRRGVDAALSGADEAGAETTWDVVVDASGAAAAVEDGLARVARGGTFLQVGVVPRDAVVRLSPYDVYAREIQIRGSMTTLFSFPRALRLLASGAVDTEGFVGPAHPLTEYESALEGARRGDHLKVVVAGGAS